jgi:hypothetical protein
MAVLVEREWEVDPSDSKKWSSSFILVFWLKKPVLTKKSDHAEEDNNIIETVN